MDLISNIALFNDKDGYIIPLDIDMSSDFKDAAFSSRANLPASTLGSVTGISDGPVIVHDSIVIKPKNSFVMGMPSSFSFALPVAKAVADRAAKLYDAGSLYQATIVFVAQRDMINSGNAPRQNFANWHHHRSDSGVTVNQSDVDMTWIFSDEIPTEFKDGEKAIAAAKNSLSEFGGDIVHRSQTYQGKEPLSRTFGMFILYSDLRLRHGRNGCGMANNNIFGYDNLSRRAEFERAAENYLKEHAGTYQPLPQSRLIIPADEPLLAAA